MVPGMSIDVPLTDVHSLSERGQPLRVVCLEFQEPPSYVFLNDD